MEVSSEPKSRFVLKYILVLVLLEFLLIIATFLPFQLNYDVAYFLAIGQRLIGGDILYQNVIDLNPPMIAYLSAIPALFAKVTGLSLIKSGLIFFHLLMFSTGFLFALNVESIFKSDKIDRIQVLIVWLIVSMASLPANFAQRDQLVFWLISALIPFRIARCRGVKVKKWLAWLTGIVAFVGLAMKPQYFIIFLILEIILAVKHGFSIKRLLLPEILAVLILGTGYLLHFFLIPGMEAYFYKWIPLVSAGYQKAYAPPLKNIFDETYSIIKFFLAFASVPLTFYWLRRENFVSYCFSMAAFASLLAMLIQGKGWAYHTIPMASFAGLSIYFLARDYKRFLIPASVFLFVAMLPNPVKLLSFNSNLNLHTSIYSKYAQIIEEITPENSGVFFVNDHIDPGCPSVQIADRKLCGTFLTQFVLKILAAEYKKKKSLPPELEKYDQIVIDTLKSDVKSCKPAAVFVQTVQNDVMSGKYYSLNRYLKRKKFFEFLRQDYKFQFKAGSYKVYARKEFNQPLSGLTLRNVKYLESINKMIYSAVVQ